MNKVALCSCSTQPNIIITSVPDSWVRLLKGASAWGIWYKAVRHLHWTADVYIGYASTGLFVHKTTIDRTVDLHIDGWWWLPSAAEDDDWWLLVTEYWRGSHHTVYMIDTERET